MRSKILLDTSALTHYLATAVDGGRVSAGRLDERGDLVVAPQCLYELYAVATRPAENRGGFGLTPKQAARVVDDFRADLVFLPEPENLFELWRNLVVRHGVTGRATHDARLAAFALGHEIGTIATRDKGGFARFGLEEIEPEGATRRRV